MRRPKIAFLFKTFSLAELTYMRIRLNRTKPLLGNTKKTDRNNVNEQATLTLTEKDSIRKG